MGDNEMKKWISVIICSLLVMILMGCGAQKDSNTEIIGGADGPTSVYLAPKSEESKETEEIKMEEVQSEPKEPDISDEQALLAVKNYCFINNPDLEKIVEDGEYQVYWDIASSNEDEIIVLFRSYTGAQNRYYIDPVSGDTYVTELVPGIIDEEQRTEESFNVKDYLTESGNSADSESHITGTWQTASMGYEDDGQVYPEYYVQFTDTDINYGHLKDGEFILDHSDKISSFEVSESGRYKVMAEGSNGVQYTFQTAETDSDVLEYYETWNEDEFSDTYRGGASLSRSNLE